MLLAAGWLQIPDSHGWQFALSMLSGVLLVVAFLWLYIATFRYLRPCVPPPSRWLSCLVLAVFVALWWLLLQPIAAGRAHESLVAGYLELAIADVGALPSRLLQAGGMAGTYL